MKYPQGPYGSWERYDWNIDTEQCGVSFAIRGGGKLIRITQIVIDVIYRSYIILEK